MSIMSESTSNRGDDHFKHCSTHCKVCSFDPLSLNMTNITPHYTWLGSPVVSAPAQRLRNQILPYQVSQTSPQSTPHLPIKSTCRRKTTWLIWQRTSLKTKRRNTNFQAFLLDKGLLNEGRLICIMKNEVISLHDSEQAARHAATAANQSHLLRVLAHSGILITRALGFHWV